MSESNWGLMGPDYLTDLRRTRTLNLASVVRQYNDLAVPGIGGLWYGKQLLIPTLGVAVAQEVRSRGMDVTNIKVANVLEALACTLSFQINCWTSDERLRGFTKIPRDAEITYKEVSQPRYYVSTPMRQSIVQALPSLGLVESDSVRFNTFQCTEIGLDFIDQAVGPYRPYKNKVLEYLTQWVMGLQIIEETNLLMKRALSLLHPSNENTNKFLKNLIVNGGQEEQRLKNRRKNALSWIDSICISKKDLFSWTNKPDQIDPEHWHDLHAGALFFIMRDAALATLDSVEAHLRQASVKKLSLKDNLPEDSEIDKAIKVLRSKAEEFLNLSKNFGASIQEAISFGEQCCQSNSTDVLRSLVERDGLVLRLEGEFICPGGSFKSKADARDDTQSDQFGNARLGRNKNIPLPPGISYRMRNLYLLNLDMKNKLSDWLKNNNQTEGAYRES